MPICLAKTAQSSAFLQVNAILMNYEIIIEIIFNNQEKKQEITKKEPKTFFFCIQIPCKVLRVENIFFSLKLVLQLYIHSHFLL